MSAKKKAKKRMPKPVLAWCIMPADGPIMPDNCYAEKSMAEYWADADKTSYSALRLLARRIGVQGVPQ